jgi:hypothetical protein
MIPLSIIAKKILKENTIPDVLYHGAPYKFNKFKDTTTFFSDDTKFAINYAEEKSQDAEMDADIYLISVKLTCSKLFDPENMDHIKSLSERLPDTVKYAYNNFGFKEEVPKAEYLQLLNGDFVEHPIDDIKGLKVGGTFPDPEYKSDKLEVVDIDDDNVTAINKKSIEYQFNDFMNGYKSTPEMTNLKEFIKNYYKDSTGSNYMPDQGMAVMLQVFINKKDYYGTPVPPKKFLNQFDKLYQKARQSCIDYLIKNGSVKKFTRKSVKRKTTNTWRYFENGETEHILRDLGFCGYVAKEKGTNTYAVFSSKYFKIIDTQKVS